MKKTIVGVFGGSEASEEVYTLAEKFGADIARNGWVVLTGGDPAGVMEAGLKGAADAGGETVGVLDGTPNTPYSKYITIPLFTNAGLARDYTNVLSSDVAVFVGPVTAGTFIELAYALKTKTPIILLAVDAETASLVETRSDAPVAVVADSHAAVVEIRAILSL